MYFLVHTPLHSLILLGQERYVVREDPNNNTYYWLTGELHNNEPEAEDTDEFVVRNGYASVVPCHVDMTHYATV